MDRVNLPVLRTIRSVPFLGLELLETQRQTHSPLDSLSECLSTKLRPGSAIWPFTICQNRNASTRAKSLAFQFRVNMRRDLCAQFPSGVVFVVMEEIAVDEDFVQLVAQLAGREIVVKIAPIAE